MAIVQATVNVVIFGSGDPHVALIWLRGEG
jgi:hypothetical protein